MLSACELSRWDYPIFTVEKELGERLLSKVCPAPAHCIHVRADAYFCLLTRSLEQPSLPDAREPQRQAVPANTCFPFQFRPSRRLFYYAPHVSSTHSMAQLDMARIRDMAPARRREHFRHTSRLYDSPPFRFHCSSYVTRLCPKLIHTPRLCIDFGAPI